MPTTPTGSAFTRRALLSTAGSAAAVGLLAACSSGGTNGGGGGGSSKPLKFWNMPWGPAAFLTEDQRITKGYKPASGLPSVQYQQIQWANFTQTFSTAVASNSNPAVSSGGGTTAVLFEKQGKIAYLDDMLKGSDWTSIKADFLPGLLDTLKGSNGQVALPYNLDMRVFWYNKQLLDSVGATPPTTWDEFEAACAKLKTKGIYGYGTYAGAGAFTGGHTLVSHMINNGGGLFNADMEVDCVTDANITAMEWVLGLVQNGYVDPHSSTYTSANAYTQMNAGKFGMIWDGAGTPANVNASVASQLQVGTPLTGPDGSTKGALYFPNNMFIFKNNTSEKGAEAFLTYYYQNMKTLWTKKTGIGLPPLKSIATAAYANDPQSTDIINNWQPISKTWGAPGSNTVFFNVTKVDGTQPMITFAQQILGGSLKGKAGATQALTTLQNALKSA